MKMAGAVLANKIVEAETTGVLRRENQESFDLIVMLGSQVMRVGKEYKLAAHTRLKADAAAIAWKMGMTGYFLVTGGYNFGVRHDDEKILLEADFSFETCAKAQFGKSEAEIIRDYMIRNWVPGYRIFLEELSLTDAEHAKFIKILLKRYTFGFVKKIGILTMVYHFKGFAVFKEEFYSKEKQVFPVFAEDIIVRAEEETGIERVCHYYQKDFPLTYGESAPFNIEKMREILESGRSIQELLEE